LFVKQKVFGHVVRTLEDVKSVEYIWIFAYKHCHNCCLCRWHIHCWNS